MQLISKSSVLSAKLKFRLRCFDFGSVSAASFLDINEEEVEAMITLQVFKSFAASHSTTRSSFRSGVVSKSAPKHRSMKLEMNARLLRARPDESLRLNAHRYLANKTPKEF